MGGQTSRCNKSKDFCCHFDNVNKKIVLSHDLRKKEEEARELRRKRLLPVVAVLLVNVACVCRELTRNQLFHEN